jgi:hypothetical protein
VCRSYRELCDVQWSSRRHGCGWIQENQVLLRICTFPTHRSPHWTANTCRLPCGVRCPQNTHQLLRYSTYSRCKMLVLTAGDFGWLSVRARNFLRYLIWQPGVLWFMETGDTCYRQHWNAMWMATSIRVRLGMGMLGLVAAWRVPPASCSVGTARSCGTAGSHGQVGPCVLVHTISYSPVTLWN